MLALAMQFSRTRLRTYERQLRPSIRRAVVVGRGFRGYSLGTKQRARICPNRKAEGAKANDRLGVKLLRKEVIQPHLPVRLPCSRRSPCRHEAWTISSSWLQQAGASSGARSRPPP